MMTMKMATMILKKAGYRLLIACDGEEAMSLLESHAEEIDLAVLDAIMPKKSGRQVYDAIKAQSSKVPVLFCSGYAFADAKDQGLPEGRQMLSKPYRPTELLQTIRSILDARTTTTTP